ncbi:MAG TPA: nuclease-related domain-containing protein [Candidatus Limnocylindria bacterium]|nr:nuclease-related domain-containing protein [Candidatus Limnocylindria bacterium]
MGGLRSAFTALAGGGSRARLADRAAEYLGERLSSDHVVLTQYAPRDDGSDAVPLVILGPHGVLVVEPRDEPGSLACYQDHWYRRTAPGVSRPFADSPSTRARSNAARVKRDLASGGFIYASVEGVVVLTRGQPDDVGSSCVPVIAGMDALIQHLETHAQHDATVEKTRALVGALSGPIRVATA